jgi:hypothetical protein
VTLSGGLVEQPASLHAAGQDACTRLTVFDPEDGSAASLLTDVPADSVAMVADPESSNWP